MSSKKEEVERIFDRAKYEALALVCGEPAPVLTKQQETTPEWLTKEQLAAYWQLSSISGIEKWIKRKSDQFPLPHAYMGDLLRFPRKEVDQWALAEAERRERKRLQPARDESDSSTPPASKRPNLSVAGSKGDDHASL
jgi:predicted DNA-binding transcriptional regulator AlpA